MSDFSFIHAADLHLDSPLIGLAGRAPEFAARVEAASRQALDNLVALAVEERCRFVLFAGDLFDGELRNIRAGLFLVSRMKRLQEAGIDAFVILGNHDAENRFMAKLDYSSNVHLFPTRAAGTRRVAGLDVAIHGRSFPQRDVFENIAADYPAPVPGLFNIGMLHTACGPQGEHAAYAPCTVEQLQRHGYDYWALGHIHKRQTLSQSPPVVYPGNLQGRSIRETGDKGATLVRVRDGVVLGLEHRTLDAVRWAAGEVDLAGVETMAEVLIRMREAMEAAADGARGLPLALRLSLTGATRLHQELALGRAQLRDEVETIAAGLTGDVWLEKLVLGTAAPGARGGSIDPTVAGELATGIAAIAGEEAFAADIESRLAEIRAKLPASARADELFAALRETSAERARDLALALIAGEGGADAVR